MLFSACKDNTNRVKNQEKLCFFCFAEIQPIFDKIKDSSHRGERHRCIS